jgi:hypothetical protein
MPSHVFSKTVRHDVINTEREHKMNVLDELKALLLPSEYRKQLDTNVPESWLVLRKGAYLFAAVPFAEVPNEDYASTYVKDKIKRMVTAWPIIAEKGLFLLYYGNVGEWNHHKDKFKVDKTALRPVILQSVHFLDPDTGDNYNIRTNWGPVKFGFCGGVIGRIEAGFQKR